QGFRYSEAMRTSGIIWNDETLDAFLKNPRLAMPGNAMRYLGLRIDPDRAAMIRYLKTLRDSEQEKTSTPEGIQ
ncbi:MAG: cytochrome C, partial [Magnetococcales bacterium]|nr:cytochrome C [Magnetococcales bacterium]